MRVLIFLIPFILLSFSGYEWLNALSYFATIIFGVVLVFLFGREFSLLKIKKRYAALMFFLILTLVYYVFNIILNIRSNAVFLSPLIQMVLIFFLLFFMFTAGISFSDYRFLAKVVLFSFSVVLFLDFSGISLYANPNSLGMFAFVSLFFAILLKEQFIGKLGIVLGFIGLVISLSRSVQISAALVFLFLLGKYFFPYRNFVVSRLFFYGFIVLLSSIPVIYSSDSQIGDYLFVLNQHVSAKQFESGRLDIWEWTMGKIYENPIFGYGLGNIPSEYGLSVHNFYIQLTYQTGVVGLLFFFSLIYNIFTLNNASDSHEGMLSNIFLFGIMIQQSFEVAWTQNNFAIGLLMWFIIGYGFATHRFREKTEERAFLCNRI